MKNIILIILVYLFVHNLNSATPESIMQVGEKLKYEVSFLGIGLGSIEMSILGKEELDGIETYKVKADIKTYRGIPFVDLKAIFNSWVDKSVGFSRKFTSNSKVDDKTWEFNQLIFDYNNNNLNIKTWLNKDLKSEKDIEIDKKFNDGSSLFYLARRFTDLKKTVKIPTVINNALVSTNINFHGKNETIEVKNIKYPVKSLYFDGSADWEGLYGLSGSFEGWFSDDEARVPILAKMNVYVGKVNIELVEWTRKGWTPPAAN